MDLPDLDSLAAFVAAVEERSFRRAAQRVALSPPAFSDRIRKLEELLGERLFDRTTRSVTPTTAARRLLPEATATLARARACVEVVADPDRRAPWSVRVGTRFELGMSWLVPALADLEAHAPERRVHLWFGQAEELLGRLRDGRVDCVVSSSRITLSGVAYATLHPEHYDFVAQAELADGAPLEGPADAPKHRLFDVDETLPLFRYLLDGVGGADDWPFASVQYLGTIAAMRDQILAGRGVGVLPRYFVQPDLDAGLLVRLMAHVPMRSDAFRLLWREGDPRAADFRMLAQELRRQPLR